MAYFSFSIDFLKKIQEIQYSPQFISVEQILNNNILKADWPQVPRELMLTVVF